jgi:hypothetical protein
MPYTYKTLTLVWLFIFGLFALSGSGVLAGRWVLLLIAAVFAIPALLLTRAKPRSANGPIATWHEPPIVFPDVRSPSPLESSGNDVHQWENEGGARHAA